MSWWLLALISGGLMAVYRIRARREDQRRKSVWRKVALSRGGMYHERQGLLSATIDAIDVDVDQIRVHLDRDDESNRTPRRTYTRCRARYLLPHAPEFCIYTEGVLASIEKALGGQDLTLGVDPAFDEQFIAKCEDIQAVRRVWSPRTMRIMRRSFDKARIESDGTEIMLLTEDPLEVPGLVNEALDLVAELAGADLFGTEVLRALPDAAYQPPTGPWGDRTTPYAVVEQPVPVTMAPALLGRRVVTRATAGDGPRDRPLKIIVRSDGSAEPADSVAQLPPAAAGFLRRAGNGTLVVDGASTSFTWLEIETDSGRLMAGVGLLAALAGAPSNGVYR